jgi:TonB-dependent receptor
MGAEGFVLDEITNKSDQYDASAALAAGFVLFDNKWERFRLSWGARMEHFDQQLHSVDYSNLPVNPRLTTTEILPSANLKYELNEKTNLRFSASKTVTRPEFRELAPFSYYDFYLQSSVTGNPTLKTGKIFNADLRYEIYPGQNQLFSFSLFYKNFKDPIENVLSGTGSSKARTFSNVPSAQNYGLEMELRKNFGFISEGFENVVFFTNAALIRSKVDLSKISTEDPNRPLQGQSPYILNAGLQWNNAFYGLNAAVSYNIIGDRLQEVGAVGYNDIYEQHRNLSDCSISKKLGTRGEIKFTWSDILKQPFNLYQDNNFDHKFNNTDNLIQKITPGSTISLTASVRL